MWHHVGVLRGAWPHPEPFGSARTVAMTCDVRLNFGNDTETCGLKLDAADCSQELSVATIRPAIYEKVHGCRRPLQKIHTGSYNFCRMALHLTEHHTDPDAGAELHEDSLQSLGSGVSLPILAYLTCVPQTSSHESSHC